MTQTKECARCLQTYCLQIEHKNSGICGSTSQDTTKCWKKCWECQKLPICSECVEPCGDCIGNYCKDCFSKHLYIEKKLTAECNVCHETQTLFDTLDGNHCGFDWKHNKEWGMCKSGHLVCEDCESCC